MLATRRDVLAGLAALSSSVMLAPAPRAASGGDFIDVHHHVFPPQFSAIARLHTVNAGVIDRWTLQHSLDEMDRNGVRTAVASITQPGVFFGDNAQARSLARICNDYMARLRQEYPGRFGFFAALPLPDVDASLREAAYALDELKADGIGLMTSVGNQWAGDPAFAPLFEELDRRGSVVYFHPANPACCRALMSYVTPNLIEFPHDTARAITSLMFSGTLVKRRNIKFLFSHAGGTLPVLAGRIEQLATPQQKADFLPQGIQYELQRLYFDVADSANRAALGALTAWVDLSHVMLGSDYPYVPIGVTSDGLTQLGYSAQQLRAIRRDNARLLLPRLPA
ncbi:MAG TPA: amidohydrolase family protein [Steroidobacteraceae bacterium]|nr:amidohydrolase family protein [Steroidobacteraceae bacterium]